MAMTHQNLCEHGASQAELNKLWDDDLKKMMRRRQFYETAGLLTFLASLIAWQSGVRAYWAFGLCWVHTSRLPQSNS
jgi:hypothetical protein